MLLFLLMGWGYDRCFFFGLILRGICFFGKYMKNKYILFFKINIMWVIVNCGIWYYFVKCLLVFFGIIMYVFVMLEC